MNLLGWIKPEYLFQPLRLLKRAVLSREPGEFRDAALAWGGSIRVRPDDSIGRAILLYGIYDLALSETLWRLIDSGDGVVDVGANIGYTAALMASRLGKRGWITCFEAHPTTFGELEFNLEKLRRDIGGTRIDCIQAAVSDQDGVAHIAEPVGFQHDRGGATVQTSPNSTGEQRQWERKLEVVAVRLDRILEHAGRVGLMKIDVEGYEAHVLRGASEMLAARRVRDIIFEDLSGYPSPVSTLLEQAGYGILEIRKSMFGPRLTPACSGAAVSAWEPRNFLATLAIDRAVARSRARGWQILSARGRR